MSKKEKQENGIKIIAKNRKAFADFEIFDIYEAGIVLQGSEVKSLREGKANFVDSYVDFIKGEPFLIGLHISQYKQKSDFLEHNPYRNRKLLLNKREINKLYGRVTERGFTIVPLKLYFRNGFVKVEIAVAKGKKKYDKRGAIAKRDADRRIERLRKKTE